MKEVLLAIAAVAFIVAGAWYACPPQHAATIGLQQISTERVTQYPYQAGTGRCNFVEMVD